MELQCKERVDLLEALRKSREEAAKEGESGARNEERGGGVNKALPSPGGQRINEVENWLAGGTVPPLGYPDLSRPPPLPQRPQLPIRQRSSGSETAPPKTPDDMPLLSPFASLPRVKETKNSRTPSPEKRTMLRTLRPAGKERTPSSSSSKVNLSTGSRTAIPAAKAATQAWAGPRTSDIGGKASPLSISAAQSSIAPTPPKHADRPRISEPNILAYRKEYTPNSTNPIDTKDAINEARRKHGLSGPSASSSVDPYQQSDSDLVSDRQDSTPRRRDRHQREGRTALSGNPTSSPRINRRPVPGPSTPNRLDTTPAANSGKHRARAGSEELSSSSFDDTSHQADSPSLLHSDDSQETESGTDDREWKAKVENIMRRLPKGVDQPAARQILNDIVVHGDKVHWSDVAGLDIAKVALKENVVYPFLRPDLFMGLREPARGMLLFGPPGTGKTMLARAVATESKSTFFAISASSLTSKWLGESEKLVRALFALAKALAPSIIFVDEIDSLLSARGGGGEHEATRRIKTEFLIQWSDLARAAAGREQTEREKERGDASRVLVLAATNLPWAIDEAARRRFVRRQYIPLPEDDVRATQLRTLLSAQKHSLKEGDIGRLVRLTDGMFVAHPTYCFLISITWLTAFRFLWL
jgi:SpoVK/Ycf46/Vps4 family AAA+-type ATPase